MPRGENWLIVIDEVKRDKTGKVLSVTVSWDKRITLCFIWRNGKLFETSRMLQKSRWDSDAASIPEVGYREMLSQVRGIFHGGNRKKLEPGSEPEKLKPEVKETQTALF